MLLGHGMLPVVGLPVCDMCYNTLTTHSIKYDKLGFEKSYYVIHFMSAQPNDFKSLIKNVNSN
mgnify:CR=1 FL=1